MTAIRPILTFASAAALALVLASAARAEAPAAEPAAVAAPPAATESPVPTMPHAMAELQAEMERRAAEMSAERAQRYQELRARAAEVGLMLPETPPWEQAAMEPPAMPDLPEPPAMPPMELPSGPISGMNTEELKAYLQQLRAAEREQRERLRELRWAETRARAAIQGIELSETPPWELAKQRAEERRAKLREQIEAARARWEAYRAALETLTPEQREAVQAVFGSPRRPQVPVPMEDAHGPTAPVMPRPMVPGYGAQQPPMGYPGAVMPKGPGYQWPGPAAPGYHPGW